MFSAEKLQTCRLINQRRPCTITRGRRAPLRGPASLLCRLLAVTYVWLKKKRGSQSRCKCSRHNTELSESVRPDRRPESARIQRHPSGFTRAVRRQQRFEFGASSPSSSDTAGSPEGSGKMIWYLHDALSASHSYGIHT